MLEQDVAPLGAETLCVGNWRQGIVDAIEAYREVREHVCVFVARVSQGVANKVRVANEVTADVLDTLHKVTVITLVEVDIGHAAC